MDDKSDEFDGSRNFRKNEVIRKRKLRQQYLKQKQAEYRKAAKERGERLKLATLIENGIGENTEEAIEIGMLNFDEELLLDINSDTETHPECSNQNFDPGAEDCSLSPSDENSDLGDVEGYCSSEESEDSDAAFHFAPAEPDAPGTLWDDLRTAVSATSMTTTQIDALLAVLHKYPSKFGNLPKSHKSLLKVYSTIPPTRTNYYMDKTNFNSTKLVNTTPSRNKTNSDSKKLVKITPGLSNTYSNSSKMLNNTPSPRLTGMYCYLIAIHLQLFIFIF